jgi:hypothetical protein
MAEVRQREGKVEFNFIRRVVVGHNAEGKAVALFDRAALPKQRSPGGNAVTNLWVTTEFPVDLAGVDDKAETQVGVPPPANGTIFRIVDFPPVSAPSSVPRVDRNKMLIAMGLDPAAQGYA